MTILEEIEAFLAETGMSSYRFGVLAKRNASMVTHLRQGRGMQPKTQRIVRAFIEAERQNPTPTVVLCVANSTCCDCGGQCGRGSTRCRKCSGIVRRGVARRRQDREKPCPADFVQIAATRKTSAICKHYGVGERTVKRWFAQHGIVRTRATRLFDPSRPVRAPKPVAVPAPKPRKAGAVVYRQVQPRPLPDHRDNSRAGLAAQFLQRFGPIVRCDENGRLNATGTHWLRGGRFVLTDGEIIDRATRQGWAPDEWMKVRAA